MYMYMYVHATSYGSVADICTYMTHVHVHLVN